MHNRSGGFRGRLAWLVPLLAALALSCDGFEEILNPPPGKTCYDDADCVPNGCCGEATSAIHKDDAPDCSEVRCTGSCPLNQLQCGCGVPVCKDQRCGVAFQTGSGC